MIGDFVLLPDVTCDLSKELRDKYNIDFVPGKLAVAGGEEFDMKLEWERFSRQEFYSDLGNNPNKYTTAPPNIEVFYEYFEKYVKQGIGVISLCISTGISGTYSFACSAKKMILEKYPDAKIFVIDTLRFGPGFGLMTIKGYMLKEQGYSIEEVYEYLEKNKNCFHQMGWVDDLSFVAKRGRISHAKAFFGQLIGVKPMGDFDSNGLTTIIGKAKGEKSAYKAVLEYIDNTAIDIENQIVLIATTNRDSQAQHMKKLLEEKYHPKYGVYINEIFPSCGVNIGPGLMAVYYYGKEISKDLEQEKNLMSKILEK